MKLVTFCMTYLIMAVYGLLYAQIPDSLWIKNYGSGFGGVGGSTGYGIDLTATGGFIMAGDIQVAPGVWNSRIIKADASGDTLWQRFFPFSSAASIQTTSDGGSIASGVHLDSTFLMRLHADGSTAWTTNFRAPLTNSSAAMARETADGGFVVTGRSAYFGSNSHLHLLKTDSSGNVLWSWMHGGGFNEVGLDVKELSSGGYIVVGSTGSHIPAGSDVYLLRAGANGDTLWTRTYGGNEDDWGDSVWETSDGGFIILGNSRSFFPGTGFPYSDAYVIRTNSVGDTLWTRSYSNWDGNDDWMYDMQPTQDGGFVMVGTSFDRVWVVKIDSIGNTLWSSLYEIGTNEFASSVKETSDGGYAITGAVKFGPSANPRNFILFKIGTPTGVSGDDLPITRRFSLLQNYPNPFNPSTTIRYKLPKSAPVRLEIYNLLGQRVATLADPSRQSLSTAGWHEIVWNGRSDAGAPVASGVYLYRLVAGDYSAVRKMLLVR